MLDIQILSIGGVKERYFQSAIDEYAKRLSPYAKLRFEELKAESFKAGGEAKARQAETLRLLSYLDKKQGSDIYFLDEGGHEYHSRGFADELELLDGKKAIFVIAGSLGYDHELIPLDSKRLSLSQMTFPHELAKVLLLEQIYRGITILKGKSYHY